MATSPDPEVFFNMDRNQGDLNQSADARSLGTEPVHRMHMGRGDQIQAETGGGQNLFNFPMVDQIKGNKCSHSKVTIKPDTFTGEDDWEQYISHFDNCAELGGWSDRERVLTLAACLKGQARIFYAGLLQNDKQSYRLLVHKLEQRFGSARQHSTAAGCLGFSQGFGSQGKLLHHSGMI